MRYTVNDLYEVGPDIRDRHEFVQLHLEEGGTVKGWLEQDFAGGWNLDSGWELIAIGGGDIVETYV